MLNFPFALPLSAEKLLKVKTGDKALTRFGYDKYVSFLCSMKSELMECKFFINVYINFKEKKVR